MVSPNINYYAGIADVVNVINNEFDKLIGTIGIVEPIE